MSPEELILKRAQGDWSIPMDAGIDAKSVFDAIVADNVKVPDEKLLLNHALAMRQYLEEKLVDRIYWFDTVDMLPDGMTKGSIDREPLIKVCHEGAWTINRESFHIRELPDLCFPSHISR